MLSVLAIPPVLPPVTTVLSMLAVLLATPALLLVATPRGVMLPVLLLLLVVLVLLVMLVFLRLLFDGPIAGSLMATNAAFPVGRSGLGRLSSTSTTSCC